MGEVPNPNFDPAQYGALISYFSEPKSASYPYISPLNADLSGKSVFITGASQGIGRNISVAFAKAGCSRIAITSRSDGSLAEVAEEVKAAAIAASRAEPQVLTLRVDVSVEEDVKAAVDQVSNAFGGSLDVLINNAGILEHHIFVKESDPHEWWSVLEVNVRGMYLTTRYFLPLLLGSDLKAVVNLTSGLSLMVFEGYSAYCLSKVAICRYTEFLASEYARQGLVAFSLEPGLVATKCEVALHSVFDDSPRDAPELTPDSIVWLVKKKREWLTGRIVSARWDMEEAEKRKEEIVEKDLFKFKVTLG